MENLNKKTIFDNISYLLKKHGMKVGDLESQTGVSPGYISRASKDGGTKPGIDFLMNIAAVFSISVDTLININLANLTPTEIYLVSFIEKLQKDTETDKLDWKRDSKESLNRMETDINGNAYHPLFSYETFYEESECEYPDEVSRVVFVSKSFGCTTYISDDCYNLRLKNGIMLYLMCAEKSVHRVNDKDAYAIELWMINPVNGGECLATTKDDFQLGQLVQNLFNLVKETSRHPKISNVLKIAIDAFMNDDLSDDNADEDEMPF